MEDELALSLRLGQGISVMKSGFIRGLINSWFPLRPYETLVSGGRLTTYPLHCDSRLEVGAAMVSGRSKVL